VAATSQKQRLSVQATVTEVYHCKKRALWLTQHQILLDTPLNCPTLTCFSPLDESSAPTQLFGPQALDGTGPRAS